MLHYFLKMELLTLIGSLLAPAAILVIAPDSPGPRAWFCVVLCSLLPIFYLGRRDRWIERRIWPDLLGTPRGQQILLVEVAWLVFLSALLGAVGGAGAVNATLAIFTWGLVVLSAAFALDNSGVETRVSWACFIGGMLVLFWLPLLAAPLFGQTALSPWLETVTIGLHPASMLLGAFGQTTLQDPLFYRFTLSGVVEVRPLWWGWPTLVYLLVAFAVLSRTVLSVPKPHQASLVWREK